ncbi:hypothetical protein GCM10010307_47340 [Streptomyces vastus]|uniref:Uncharacterized protein n=1 Tax=Streptomyces vastus TaxID=285451 RepID=A0ABN3R4F1_9ACTN
MTASRAGSAKRRTDRSACGAELAEAAPAAFLRHFAGDDDYDPRGELQQQSGQDPGPYPDLDPPPL